MTPLISRAIAGGAVAGVLAIGASMSGGLTDAEAAKAEEILALYVSPEQARAQALAGPPSYTQTMVFYRTELEATLAAQEFEADIDTLIARLHQPNRFFQAVALGAPVVLKPTVQPSDPAVAAVVSDSFRHAETGFEIALIHEELRVKRGGLESTSPHTLVRLHNQGSAPLAYHLVARSADTGDCKVRAITQYDALVLDPGEQARVSICPGTHEVEIIDARIMEVTPVGARWIRQVPVAAFGLDDIAGRSHKPTTHVTLCSVDIGVEGFAERLAAGEAAWEDIADYYSRHDCNFYRWPASYKRIVEPLDALPVGGPPPS